eukprot:CAMPEP_0115387088 /NCGR_PEP_ID=MMETSP0271-20121206/8481_1 /TAXON_ID=71861 /ORGANISM="Scrippsiella trochoidea, Strain CCMP3099" /LENGTH=434 /DNA_ID=CAMNT_0002810539 /DNA_START=86 /DNA_END=1388 /DNA_ORIENTATION=-
MLRLRAHDFTTTFQQDDLCESVVEEMSSTDACALHALQLRARKSISKTARASTSNSLLEGDLGSSPMISRTWSGHATLSRSAMGRELPKSMVEFWYDDVNHRYRRLDRNVALTTDQLSVDALGYNSFFVVGEGHNATCVASLNEVSPNPFDWLVLAYRNGTSQINGEECELWTTPVFSEVPSSQYRGDPFRFLISNGTIASACFGADGVPREVTMTLERARFDLEDVFSDIHVGAPPEGTFAPDASCAQKLGLRCPAGQTSQIDLYRIHGPKENLVMADRNFADPAASLNLLCKNSRIVNASLTNAWVSHWSLSVNTSWGVYRKCWYREGHNMCEGSGGAVGRQFALMVHSQAIGHDTTMGQCIDEAGAWYTLPSDGHCVDDARVGAGGCTWGSEHRVHSASAACVAARACTTSAPGAAFTADDIEAFEVALAG